jgi:hypothetical protein
MSQPPTAGLFDDPRGEQGELSDPVDPLVEWGSYDTEEAPAPDGRVRAVWLLPTPGGTCAALAGDTAARQEIALLDLATGWDADARRPVHETR